MASTPIKSGRLPPQAPSSRPPAPHTPSKSDVDALAGLSKSSRQPSGSRSRSRRTRSSSDGVRAMNQHHQQQQQQYQQQQYQQQYYQGQGGGYGQNNNYPVQQSNQPPPGPGGYAFHRGGPSDGSKLAPAGNYGSIPPPIPPRPRSRSKEFSAMNELSSVIGRSGGGARSSLNFPNSRPAGKKRGHRRVASDSMVQQPLMPPIYPGNRLEMPNPNHPGAPMMQHNLSYQGPHGTNYQGGPSMMRHDSYQGGPPLMPADSYQGGAPPIMRVGSHISQASHGPPSMMRVGSHHSSEASHGPPSLMRSDSHNSQASHGQHPGSVYAGGGMGGEREAFLAQQGGGGVNTVSPNKGARRPMLMRQNSVNNFMQFYKGDKQPRSYKDVLFGVLFLAQLACMLFAGAKFGPQALVTTAAELGPGEGLENDDLVDYNSHVLLAYQNIIKRALMCGAFAMLVSALALAFMVAMSRRLVYVALVLSIGVSFVWGTIGIGISPNSFVPVTGIVALMLTVGYMFVVWDRIPFASANLTTAVTGVRENLGLVGVAFFFQFLALLTSVYVCFTYVGLRNAMLNGQLGDLDDNWRNVLLGLLVVSYLWTYQVLRHIVMVTVAGTIGSWWFDTPSAIKETFLHATVYNFGSICYGTLFIGFVQVLRQFTEGLRPNHEGSSMMCLYECSVFFQGKIVGCVDILSDTFTPWAYPYIGLYHYGLKEAGHKANELFDKRGWSRIVTDDLITSVLFLCSLVIGGLSGCFAVVLQILNSTGLTSFGHPVHVSFMIGFMIGIVLSAVLFSIIGSSVSAVIVCFAASPVEFHHNHPELSREMNFAWKEVWPGSLDTDNGGSGLA